MIKNVIKHDDKVYVINRTLPSSTNESDADRIHRYLRTDTLLRDKDGTWFCCNTAREVEFRDVEKSKPVMSPQTLTPEDFAHTQFELGDNGGLG